ncbi:hypothetical protein, partial [Acinetobacter sp. AGC35]
LVVMKFTGYNFMLKSTDILFIGGLYVSLFPVGRFVLMRMLLQKPKGRIYSYLIEVGYTILIILIYWLLPISYCLIFFIVMAILVVGFQQLFLPKQGWNRFFEEGM